MNILRQTALVGSCLALVSFILEPRQPQSAILTVTLILLWYLTFRR